MTISLHASNEGIKFSKNDLQGFLEKHKDVENACERMELIWTDMKLDAFQASKSIVLYLNEGDTELSHNYALEASLALITEGYIEWDQYVDADNSDYIESLFNNYLDGELFDFDYKPIPGVEVDGRNIIKAEIIHQFKGIISGVEIGTEQIYWTTEWAMNLMHDKLDIEPTKDFIESFVGSLERSEEKIELFSFAMFEQDWEKYLDDNNSPTLFNEYDYPYFQDTIGKLKQSIIDLNSKDLEKPSQLEKLNGLKDKIEKDVEEKHHEKDLEI